LGIEFVGGLGRRARELRARELRTGRASLAIAPSRFVWRFLVRFGATMC
jgi:hypothetical protein